MISGGVKEHFYFLTYFLKKGGCEVLHFSSVIIIADVSQFI